MIGAVVTGFSGSLTTVSTFVTEARPPGFLAMLPMCLPLHARPRSSPGRQPSPPHALYRASPAARPPCSAQVVKLAEAAPENFRAHWYALLSLGCGALLGVVVYGWSVWAY